MRRCAVPASGKKFSSDGKFNYNYDAEGNLVWVAGAERRVETGFGENSN